MRIGLPARSTVVQSGIEDKFNGKGIDKDHGHSFMTVEKTMAGNTLTYWQTSSRSSVNGICCFASCSFGRVQGLGGLVQIDR